MGKDAGDLPGFRRTADSLQLLDSFHLQQSLFFDAKSEDKKGKEKKRFAKFGEYV